ncbi:hypothetical protein BH23ACT10_BH23ACT10_30040 [soil metagenome]
MGSAQAKLAQAERAAAQHPPAAEATDDADVDKDRPVQANTTDPDSRTMKTANGWVQGYNALAAGLAAGIAAQVGMLLFDAGYWSADNATAAGPDRLIATTKDWKRRKRLREQGTVVGPPPDDASPQLDRR